jgi:hypothetical protein
VPTQTIETTKAVSQTIDAHTESIDARKKRLLANRDALKNKKDESQTIEVLPENKGKDVFRRTGMKFGETEDEKMVRLKRCMNVLK